MNQPSRKLLFCFHDVALSGAPMVLYRYLTGLKSESDWEIHIAVPGEGPLYKTLSDIFKVHVIDYEAADSFKLKPLGKLFGRASKSLSVIDLLKSLQPDLLYLNTVVFEKHVGSWSKIVPQCKVCWHIHELELACNILGIHSMESQCVHRFIANSEETRDFLVSQKGVDESKIAIHYPALVAYAAAQNDVDHITFNVGSVGAGITRKGVELFLVLASIYKQNFPDDQVNFIWQGSTFAMKYELAYDLSRAQLNRVTLAKPSDDIAGFYQTLSLYACVSKEESFGLAPIEAMSFGVPLLAFEKSGATERIARESGGVVVPYFDLVALSEAIHLLYADKLKRKEMSAKARLFASQFTIDQLFPKWKQELQNLLDS